MRLHLVLPLILSACTQFPQLDETVDSEAQNAPYPELVPIETIQDSQPDHEIEPDTRSDLETRAEQLKSRAERLQEGAVVDEQTRARMATGIE